MFPTLFVSLLCAASGAQLEGVSLQLNMLVEDFDNELDETTLTLPEEHTAHYGLGLQRSAKVVKAAPIDGFVLLQTGVRIEEQAESSVLGLQQVSRLGMVVKKAQRATADTASLTLSEGTLFGLQRHVVLNRGQPQKRHAANTAPLTLAESSLFGLQQSVDLNVRRPMDNHNELDLEGASEALALSDVSLLGLQRRMEVDEHVFTAQHHGVPELPALGDSSLAFDEVCRFQVRSASF